MKNLLILALIITGFNNLTAQDQSFEFKAIMGAEVLLGKDWDYSSSNMTYPINITLKDNKLLMIYDSGEVAWDLDIENIINTKETVENGKIVEKSLALEYKDSHDFTGYIIFRYKYDILFGEDYTLKTPYFGGDGMVVFYYYYMNQ